MKRIEKGGEGRGRRGETGGTGRGKGGDGREEDMLHGSEDGRPCKHPVCHSNDFPCLSV